MPRLLTIFDSEKDVFQARRDDRRGAADRLRWTNRLNSERDDLLGLWARGSAAETIRRGRSGS
jgi:hypothetical protein